MTDLKDMSVSEIPFSPDGFDELVRRLRDQGQLYTTTRAALGETSEQQEEQLRQRSEQAEAALEQMTAKCSVLLPLLQGIYESKIAEHTAWEVKTKETLSNLPASVEKLLAIKRAAEDTSRHELTPIGDTANYDCLAASLHRQQQAVRAYQENKP